MLVGAAVQTLPGQTGQEVGGNTRKERTQPLIEPQVDDGGIIEAGRVEPVQSDLTYRVQNHRQRRISGVQNLSGKRVSVYI